MFTRFNFLSENVFAIYAPVELADVFKNGPMSQEKWPNVPRNCPQCPEIDICPNGPEVS